MGLYYNRDNREIRTENRYKSDGILLLNVNSSEKGNSMPYYLIKTSKTPNICHLYNSRDPITLFKNRKLKEY